VVLPVRIHTVGVLVHRGLAGRTTKRSQRKLGTAPVVGPVRSSAVGWGLIYEKKSNL